MSKSLEHQIGARCVHFNGLANKACDAGVKYDSVRAEQAFPGNFPCFRDGEHLTCEKRKFPTAEEVEAEVRSINESTDRTLKAVAAAHKHARELGLGKGKGGRGSLPCPVCGTGTLAYSVASYNGHMHACCMTQGCVSWME